MADGFDATMIAPNNRLRETMPRSPRRLSP